MKSLSTLAALGIMALVSPAAAMPLVQPRPLAEAVPAVTLADWRCGPGYHVGWGGQRCWPNGQAPAEEIPPGFVVPPPLPRYANNPPPVLECPAGYHLGRGRQRCWPN